jgi:hypothetical protein
MGYLRAAFDAVVPDAQEPESWFVVLVESCRCYGGPEEGGWWYTDQTVAAYREYATRTQADAAAARVETLAGELEAEARSSHGDHCLRQAEWLEARGLDADFLPENDGPNEYHVIVCDEVPVFSHCRPHYC